MKTNDILRKLSQALDFDVVTLQAIFAQVDMDLNEKEIANLLKTDYVPNFEPCPDYVLVLFLNGLINSYRGKKSDAAAEPINKTAKIANNDVLKKLRIAFNLQEQQVRDCFKLVTIELTKSDLAALFRKPGQPQFKACSDELLMDFIQGLGLFTQQARTATLSS